MIKMRKRSKFNRRNKLVRPQILNYKDSNRDSLEIVVVIDLKDSSKTLMRENQVLLVMCQNHPSNEVRQGSKMLVLLDLNSKFQHHYRNQLVQQSVQVLVKIQQE